MQIGLEATYSEAQHVEFSPVYASNYATYEVASVRGHVAAETSLGLVEATVYTNQITAHNFPDVAASPYLSFDNQVTVANAQSISKIANNHTLRLSAEYRDNTVATTSTPGGDVFYNVGSIGSMWEWTIKPALTLTNAIRVDRLSLGRSGTVPPGYPFTNADWDHARTESSFNTGVVWQRRDGHRLRFTVARGVQLPNLLNLGGLLVTVPSLGFATGIPSLSPTLVTNYDAGWERSLPSLGAVLSVSVFRGTTRHLVANVGGFQPLAGLLSTPINIGNSRLTGVEVSIKGTVDDRWRWRASYTPTAIEDRFAPGFTLANTLVDFEDTTPRHVLNANVGWSRAPWEIDGFLRYQSSFDGIESPGFAAISGTLAPISAYVSIDARIAYAPSDRITLALAGQNITQSAQRQTASADVERRLLATFAIAF